MDDKGYREVRHLSPVTQSEMIQFIRFCTAKQKEMNDKRLKYLLNILNLWAAVCVIMLFVFIFNSAMNNY